MMLARMFEHLEWADRQVLESLKAARNPPAKTVELYAHVLGAEHVWLSRIRGEPASLAVWPVLTLDQCAEVARETSASFQELVSGLTAPDIERQITYRNSAGLSFTSTLEDILVHVALHGSYHRGQIATALRLAGEAPAPTDYIAFRRGSPAATRGIN